jgi:hypothetical protein
MPSSKNRTSSSCVDELPAVMSSRVALPKGAYGEDSRVGNDGAAFGASCVHFMGRSLQLGSAPPTANAKHWPRGK